MHGVGRGQASNKVMEETDGVRGATVDDPQGMARGMSPVCTIRRNPRLAPTTA